MEIQFTALETNLVENVRKGAPDANGQVAERHLSDGAGLPSGIV